MDARRRRAARASASPLVDRVGDLAVERPPLLEEPPEVALVLRVRAVAAPRAPPGRVDVDVDEDGERLLASAVRTLGVVTAPPPRSSTARLARRRARSSISLRLELRGTRPRPARAKNAPIESADPRSRSPRRASTAVAVRGARRPTGEPRLARAHEADQRQVPVERVQRHAHWMRSTYARVRRDEVADRVAAELVLREHRELPGDRRLGDDRERLDGGDVGALDERLRRLAGLQVDRARAASSASAAASSRRARRSPRRSTCRPRCRPRGSCRGGGRGGSRRAPPSRGGRPARSPSPISTPFTAWIPITREGEPRVEPVVLRRVRAEPRRHAGRAHLDDPADRVALGARLVDPRCSASSSTVAPVTAIPIVREQRLRDGAGRDLDGRVPRRGALERVAHVVVAVLQDAGEIGVAGPRQRDGLRSLAARLALGRPRRHPPRPVLVVVVPHDERQRRAERATVAEAREHLDAVLLDLLARRAAVALLPPFQVGVDPLAVELSPAGRPLTMATSAGP